MTRKEMFATIATINADNAEIVEFCNKEIEKLNTRKSSSAPTKKQLENEGIMSQILETLEAIGEPVTVTELLATGNFEMSNQKASALLRKLVLEGKVAKAIEGKKSRFSVA